MFEHPLEGSVQKIADLAKETVFRRVFGLPTKDQ